MTRPRKVFILCPARAVSGGPEALHQLGGALLARGVAAFMVYYPPGPHEVPAPYRHYGAAVSPFAEDDETAVIVIPEVATSLAWRFAHARKAIWWLSVDNYFKWQHINPGPSVFAPRDDLLHLCQSHYAWDFLASRHVGNKRMLTDFLMMDAFTLGPLGERMPFVAYNPKKAPETTQRLMAHAGGRNWLKLEGLDKATLADVLRQVCVYVDFGPHPGRDRLPREAALCGAIVVTGRRGAAAFAADLPIPERFRLDEGDAAFDVRARALIDTLLHSDSAFHAASAEQAPYRAWIGGNRDAFMAEVDGFIAVLDLESQGLAGAGMEAGAATPKPVLGLRGDAAAGPCALTKEIAASLRSSQ